MNVRDVPSEQRHRDVALGRDRAGGVLLKRGVEIDALFAEVGRGIERFVAELAKAAASYGEHGMTLRDLSRATDRDGAIQAPAELRWGHQHRVECGQIEVFERDRRLLLGIAEPTACAESLITTDQLETIDGHDTPAVLNRRLRPGSKLPAAVLRGEVELPQVHFLVVRV